jgi:hypothetical protein
MVRMSIKHKKSIILIQVNKREVSLIKLILKINLIKFVKKIKNNLLLIKPNFNFKLTINDFFKKKKITTTSNNKFFKKKITIVSNSHGINFLKRDGGLVMWTLTI